MSRQFKHLSEDSDEDNAEEEEDEEESELPHSKCWHMASSLLASKFWHRLVMIFILTNVVLMAIEAQYPKLKKQKRSYGFVEGTFMAFFLFEIALRIFVHGCRGFFCEHDRDERNWNWGDFCIVALGCLAYLIRPTKQGLALKQMNHEDDDTWTSIFLLLRGVRILRVIRIFRLRQLDMLIRGMWKSFEAVFWILVFGLLIIFFFAVSVTVIVGHHSELWSQENCGKERCQPGDKKMIEDLFGDLGLSMWTMFQFVTLDNWSSIIALVCERMWIMKYFFLIYTLIASFALISLLTGVMAEHIMSESQNCAKANSEEDIKRYIDNLQKCFDARNRSTAGRGLTFEELSSLMSSPKVFKSVRKLGLEEAFNQQDLEDAFYAMDLDGDRRLTWAEFQYGLRSITGPASARDVSLVRADVQRLLRRTQHYDEHEHPPPRGAVARPQDTACAERLKSMEERIGRLESAVMQLVRATSQSQAISVTRHGSPRT